MKGISNMTTEEVLHHYSRMLEIYEVLPDPDHEPKQFAYFVKLYLRYHGTQNDNSNSGSSF